MDDSIVFRLVYDISIRNNFMKQKNFFANRLNSLILKIRISEKELYISGMMELLSYISELILKEYGYSTKWFSKRIPSYYPISIQALNLFIREDFDTLDSNPLGGYRV
tara:strand:- start:3 stop:326 length:324 start_codon:yes stop_codon:yes gene_type:complete